MNINIQDLEEDFFEAYKSRMNDFLYLQREKDNHKTLIMHLGGVVLECYLKYLIVREKNINKCIFNCYWSSEETANNLDCHNLEKKTVRNHNDTIENPKHKLIDAIVHLTSLNSVMNEAMTKRLNHIQNPLETGDYTYIDLRYKENSFFEEEGKIDRWIDDFKEIVRWIDRIYNDIEG